jgi:hypothetical protein
MQKLVAEGPVKGAEVMKSTLVETSYCSEFFKT